MNIRAIAPLLVTVLFMAVVSPTAAQVYDHTLNVNPLSPSADDGNPGSSDLPLATIAEAVDRAVDNKHAYQSTRIVLHPATYREPLISFGYTNYHANDPDNQTPITIEALHAGTAVLSGSDIWLDWEFDTATGTWTKAWPHDWGTVEDPWGGVREVNEILLRREMIFVDGQLLRQVLAVGDVVDGSFYVDEAADRVYLRPPSGVSMDNPRIEVATRKRLLEFFHEDRVTIRGLVFEHTATPWANDEAAVWVSGGRHVTFEDVSIRWTNWQGLGEAEDVLLRRVELNNHGGQGWGMFRNKRVVIEDSETSYNNWRGRWGGFAGWSVGNKLLSIHGLIIRRHRATDNYSRGLWLDYDISDALLDGVQVNDNLLDGLWIEASQGPMVIKNSAFCRNGWSGLKTTYSEGVHIDNNVFALNATADDVQLNDSQLIIDGGGERVVTNFETKEKLPLVVRDWSVTNNLFIGTTFAHPYAKGPTLIDNDLENDEWTEFLKTFSSDYNTWYHPERPEVFGFPKYNDLSLDAWRQSTGQDESSVFLPSPPDYTCDVLTETRASGDADLVGEAGDQSAAVVRSVTLDGRDAGVLRFRAFDVDHPSEMRVFVNGTEVVPMAEQEGSNRWVADSLVFSADLLNDGPNEITFSVGRHPGSGHTPGYRIADVSLSTANLGVAFDDIQSQRLADGFSITGNYPNPFGEATTLTLDLPVTAEVEISVFDMLGRRQLHIPSQEMAPGYDRPVPLDTSSLSAGAYAVRVTVHVDGAYFSAFHSLTKVR